MWVLFGSDQSDGFYVLSERRSNGRRDLLHVGGAKPNGTPLNTGDDLRNVLHKVSTKEGR